MKTIGKILLIAAFLICCQLSAQDSYDSSLRTIEQKQKKSYDTDIRLVFKVFLNEKTIETSGVVVTLTNVKSKYTYTVSINNDFSLFLLPNNMYSIKIGHKGFNSKTIVINTKAPTNKNTWEINANMYLYSNKADEIAGVLYYDPIKNNFEVGPYNIVKND